MTLTIEKLMEAKRILDEQPIPEPIPVHMSTKTMGMFGVANQEDGILRELGGIPIVINESIPDGQYWLGEPMHPEGPYLAWKP